MLAKNLNLQSRITKANVQCIAEKVLAYFLCILKLEAETRKVNE